MRDALPALVLLLYIAASSLIAQVADRINGTVIGSSGSTYVVWASSDIGAAASSPSSEVTTDTVTIPAGTLAAGDLIRITAFWLHSGVATAPRVGILFDGNTLIPTTAVGATDAVIRGSAEVAVITTTSQIGFGILYRPNGSLSGPGALTMTSSTSSALAIAFRANFNAVTADTIRLTNYAVEVWR